MFMYNSGVGGGSSRRAAARTACGWFDAIASMLYARSIVLALTLTARIVIANAVARMPCIIAQLLLRDVAVMTTVTRLFGGVGRTVRQFGECSRKLAERRGGRWFRRRRRWRRSECDGGRPDRRHRTRREG